MLGVSRQRVAQLIETYEDFPQPEVELSGGRVWSRTAVETWIASHPEREPGRPEAGVKSRLPRFFGRKSSVMFERFTDRAKKAVVKAQEEARLLNHNFIGTEHLVLGLLAIGEGVAWQALSAKGVTLEATREEIARMVGKGAETPEGHIPFTPRSTKVLELALRVALHLGHNYVGTEHILLAITREGEGVGWQVLAIQGLKPRTLRTTVLDVLNGVLEKLGSQAPPRPLKAPAELPNGMFVACSFCGKSSAEVERCVAGPGVYICDECVRLCDEIITKHQSPDADPTSRRLAQLEARIDDLERER